MTLVGSFASSGFNSADIANPGLYAGGTVSFRPAVKLGESVTEIRCSYKDYTISAYSKDIILAGNVSIINGAYSGVSGITDGKIYFIEKINAKDVTDWFVADAKLSAFQYHQFLNNPNLQLSNAIISNLYSGDDEFVDTRGIDNLLGLQGNDKFILTGGAYNNVDGGDGFDIAVYGATNSAGSIGENRSSYAVTASVDPSKLILVASATDPTDIDTLASIEKISFKDGSLVFDVPKTVDASLIYRLYQAAFGRTPDDGGFRYWVDQHNKGLGFNDMAGQFRNSTEFAQKFGSNISNDQYIDLLYKNVLSRSGEAGGVTYWTNELNSGHLTKDQVLIGFASSPENVTKTAANIDNGYWLV